ncbi:hypothetical protein C8R47DRAFT_1063044 [Mycena vitilis]|nr:hypothetical protein C8R47DRAFT_1063044 [Mycena vitilis]
MSKRKKKGNGGETEDFAKQSETRERRREWLAHYRKFVCYSGLSDGETHSQTSRRPEVLEKDRLRVSGRRLATKARRRQWDPKPHRKAPNEEHLDTGEDERGENDIEEDKGVDPGEQEDLAKDKTDSEQRLTPAENFALAVLTEMATTRVIDADTVETITALTTRYGPVTIPPPVVQVRLSYADSDGIDSVLEKANQLSSDASPSDHSSALAVNEEAISVPRGRPSRYMKRLPPYVAPTTPLQKKVQRELGVIGPLTDVQQAQITAFELGEVFCMDEVDPPAPSVGPFLSSARWDMICDWRWHPEYDTDWDLAVRRAFAETALMRRCAFNGSVI